MTETNPSDWIVKYLDVRTPSGERSTIWYLHGDASATTYATEAEANRALREARRCKREND